MKSTYVCTVKALRIYTRVNSVCNLGRKGSSCVTLQHADMSYRNASGTYHHPAADINVALDS